MANPEKITVANRPRAQRSSLRFRLSNMDVRRKDTKPACASGAGSPAVVHARHNPYLFSITLRPSCPVLATLSLPDDSDFPVRIRGRTAVVHNTVRMRPLECACQLSGGRTCEADCAACPDRSQP